MSEVEAIKDAVSITEVVGRYVELKKAGINYSGRCPFHNEKTPSFFVSPDRGTFKCFGCGEGGDVFSFVEKIEGLGFREVLEKFSLETGIALQQSSSRRDGQSASKKDHYYAILEHARIYWQKQLAQNPGAIDYLKNRGISKQQVIDFAIGYAPEGWEHLKQYLVEKGVSEQDIEEVGLIKTGDKGGRYDRFRDRIIFPLRNMGGKTVAFSGRYIGNDEVGAKYLNSPETPVFNKSKELYGIDTAKQAIRKNNFVIVVEGQFDLVMGQSVYPNTVATSGTALSRQHMELLHRFADRVVFVFDSDPAGVNAAFKASLIALELDFEVRIARLPQGKDPADVIAQDVESYRAVIKDAKDVFDFWIHEINGGGISERERTKLIQERLIPLLVGHTNPLEQDRYINHVSQGIGVHPDALRTRISQLAQEHKQHSPVREHAVTPTIEEPKQTNQNPLDRLALLYCWQQSLGQEHQLVDVEDLIGRQIKDTEQEAWNELLARIKAQENEIAFFEFEKMYENSIMLENDIGELIDRVSTYRLKQRQQELTKQHTIALQQGNDQQAKELLQELDNIIRTHE